MAKKPSIAEEIKKMVAEELTTAIKEARPRKTRDNADDRVNPVFDSVKDRAAFENWIRKYFFRPDNSSKPWFHAGKNADNLLAFLSDPASTFPLSPRELVDDWYLKKSLKSSMKSLKDKELDSRIADDEEEEKAKYQTGEKSLKDIGAVLGGVTPAMIQKIERSGMANFLKLVQGRNPAEMDEEEIDSILRAVDDARIATSHEFAQNLKDARGNIKGFVQSLIKKGTLAPTDVKLMSPREIETLVFLMTKPVDQIAEYLRGDAMRDNNVVKSFQAAVAKKTFPAGKRGRPRKNA
jgi:hypothetical protein